MKRPKVILLTTTASLGLLLILLSTMVGRSDSTLAAPRSEDPFQSLNTNLSWSPASFDCTLATTTTDSLEEAGYYNDDPASAVTLADYTGLALAPGDEGATETAKDDWFRLDNANTGWTYEVEAVPDKTTNYNLGIVVYNASLTPIMTDTNPLDGNRANVALVATSQGPYYFKVFQIAPGCTGETYHLDASGATATPTPTGTLTPTPTPTNTPVPGATAMPGADQFEPNHDFDHAATLGTDITYSANFIPWGGGGGEDNDYYKIWIKPGLHFTCKTSDLAPGVDTNMIVYDGNRNGIGGNDDVELGDYSSSFSYFSTYEGWLYVLVGHGGRLPASELENSSYKIRCEKGIPGATNTPTPTGTPGPTTTQSLVATPTPSGELTVRPLTTPTPAPVGTPTARFIPVSLLVYYDANNDGQPGAGEGIIGISAQAYEAATNQLLAQGFTDAQGSLEFTVAALGPVRVSVPFFGFSQLVTGEGASIYLRIPPQPLPGEAP